MLAYNAEAKQPKAHIVGLSLKTYFKVLKLTDIQFIDFMNSR